MQAEVQNERDRVDELKNIILKQKEDVTRAERAIVNEQALHKQLLEEKTAQAKEIDVLKADNTRTK